MGELRENLINLKNFNSNGLALEQCNTVFRRNSYRAKINIKHITTSIHEEMCLKKLINS